MTSRRFLSLAAACVIGTMALAVPTLPVQAAPTSANTIVAVASVAPQTDAVSGSPAPASSHNVLAPTRRFRYHGGRGSSDPVFGTISVIIFIGLCVWNVYNRRRRSRIAQGRLQQNPPAYGGPAGPQYGAVAPTYTPTTAGFLPERKRCPTSRTAVAHRRCQTPATGMGELPASRDIIRPSRADRATASTRPPIARLHPSPGPPTTDGNTMRTCRTTPA